MGKVHKSFRIEEETAAAVSALAAEGETEAATYNRVIAAGVEALTRTAGGGETESAKEQPGETGQSAALIASLQSHIETLKAANEEISGQLRIKDKQIEALSVLTAQAQQATAKALEAPQQRQQDNDGTDSAQSEGQQEQKEEKRGFWARLFG